MRCCHDSWWGRIRCYCCALEMVQMSPAGDFLTSCAVCTWSHVIPFWTPPPKSVSVTLPEALNIHSLRHPGVAVFCTVSKPGRQDRPTGVHWHRTETSSAFLTPFPFLCTCASNCARTLRHFVSYMNNIRLVCGDFRTIWFSGNLVWVWPPMHSYLACVNFNFEPAVLVPRFSCELLGCSDSDRVIYQARLQNEMFC